MRDPCDEPSQKLTTVVKAATSAPRVRLTSWKVPPLVIQLAAAGDEKNEDAEKSQRDDQRYGDRRPGRRAARLHRVIGPAAGDIGVLQRRLEPVELVAAAPRLLVLARLQHVELRVLLRLQRRELRLTAFVLLVGSNLGQFELKLRRDRGIGFDLLPDGGLVGRPGNVAHRLGDGRLDRPRFVAGDQVDQSRQ